jgi:hypothetical protein
MMATKSDHGRMPMALGVNREFAARYIGVGPTLFDEMVTDGRMPPPRVINCRTVWDIEEVYEAFKALPHREEVGTKKAPTGWAKVS